MKAHKHAEVIKAWADGHAIQYRNEITNPSWTDMPTCSPMWHEHVEYRVKPEPKPDVVRGYYCNLGNAKIYRVLEKKNQNLKLTFDGETGKLKKAEVL